MAGESARILSRKSGEPRRTRASARLLRATGSENTKSVGSRRILTPRCSNRPRRPLVRTIGAIAPVRDPVLTTTKWSFPSRGKVAQQDSLQRYCWIGLLISPSSARQNGAISSSGGELPVGESEFLFSE